MLLYLLYSVFFGVFFNTADTGLVEDISSLYIKEDCIEAALLSLQVASDTTLILDSVNVKDASIFNETKKARVESEKDSALKINELAQYNEVEYSYELVSEDGPAHNKIFKVKLVIGDESYEGSGSSLKKAQQEVASVALENTYFEHPPIKLKTETQLTPILALNNVATQLGLQVSYYLINDKEEKAISSFEAANEAYGKSKSQYPKLNYSTSLRIPTEDPQLVGPFTVKVKVGNSEYVGFGHTIQAARHDAATKALKDIEVHRVCESEESFDECRQRKESLKSPITRIYEAAQQHNLPLDFAITDESGKSHKKIFITQCKLGDFTTHGEGNSKKDSKRAAAEAMLENLSFLPQVFNGKSITNSLKAKNKKKKKISKINVDNVGIVGKSISGMMLSSFWGEQSNQPHPLADNKVKKNGKLQSTPKEKILEMGNMLAIPVEFTDVGNYHAEFYTLASLGVDPSYICLGKGADRQLSHDNAALHGLKLLYRSGVFEKTFEQRKEQRVSIGEYLEEINVIHRSFENSEKEN